MEPQDVLPCSQETAIAFYSQRCDIADRGLMHELSSLARTLGSWIRIPLKARMFVYVYSVFVLSCVGSGLASD
jgi:hypothetical protein